MTRHNKRNAKFGYDFRFRQQGLLRWRALKELSTGPDKTRLDRFMVRMAQADAIFWLQAPPYAPRRAL